MRSCVYCKAKESTPRKLSLFRFPKDERVLPLWLKNMNFDPLWVPSENHRLCSQHFVSQCIYYGPKTPRLYKGSIPTIFGINKGDSITNYRQKLNELSQNQLDLDPLKIEPKEEPEEYILPDVYFINNADISSAFSITSAPNSEISESLSESS